ncbi:MULTISPECIES: 3'-5' exonuclease [Clostridium]|uniref:3'-5' exonuclease n=1 Tax=Clostridium senegalense TaxID=1465809 RepID=A0A6M0H2X1_9CLOT|nr:MULTISPECIES: 3'-5' exonuclease [Clostridium]NEU05120.1 3'-5' exonuclease [Clostridium senegalense]
MKMIFFDTETTGISPGNICELSYIIVDTDVKPQKTYGKNFFFAVEYVEPSAKEIHGFSEEDLYKLSNGLYFEDQFEEISDDFLNADILIGHNVNFDIKFITHELEFCEINYKPKNTFCTMNYYKNICKCSNGKGGIKNPKLEEVVNFLGLNSTIIKNKANELFDGSGNYHDARFDTAATYLVVTEGIRKGLIPKGYFTKMVKNN